MRNCRARSSAGGVWGARADGAPDEGRDALAAPAAGAPDEGRDALAAPAAGAPEAGRNARAATAGAPDEGRNAPAAAAGPKPSVSSSPADGTRARADSDSDSMTSPRLRAASTESTTMKSIVPDTASSRRRIRSSAQPRRAGTGTQVTNPSSRPALENATASHVSLSRC